METIKTLEDYHMFILFQLIDKPLPEWANWICVDSCENNLAQHPPESRIVYAFCYEKQPHMGESEWESCGGEWTLAINATTLPIGIDWKDCLWKL